MPSHPHQGAQAPPPGKLGRIAVVDGLAGDDALFQPLADRFDIVFHGGVPRDEADLVARARGADVVLTQALKARFTAAVLRQLAGTRLVVTRNAGYDNIDVEAASACGICVAHVPGGSGPAVAELVFAGLLALLRHLRRADADVRRGLWDHAPYFGTELFGKTMGIVGLGFIGQHVARIARGFGMRVLAWNRRPRGQLARSLGVAEVALDDLLAEADVVSLHTALTPETEHLLDARRLAAMRPGAILVNTARGRLVDEEALYRELASGRLGGAVLDVFTHEPPPVDHPLLALDNVVVTPHVGWYTRETLRRQVEEVIRIIEDFYAGRARHILNPHVMKRGA